MTINEQGSMTAPVAAPVAAGVTVPLLLLIIALIVVVLGLLWVKKRRRMKTENRSIPLDILSW